MSEPAAAAGPPPNPLATWFREWSGRTPPASRFVMITVVVLWLLGMLTGQALGAFANTPYYVIFHYEGAALFVSWLNTELVPGITLTHNTQTSHHYTAPALSLRFGFAFGSRGTQLRLHRHRLHTLHSTGCASHWSLKPRGSVCVSY